LEVLMAANCVRDLIYDVGMHSGEDTEFYLKKGFRVIAFEANSDLAASARSKFHDYIAKDKLVIVQRGHDTTLLFSKKNALSPWRQALVDCAPPRWRSLRAYPRGSRPNFVP
jgi:hypothetical protein